jgi:hypothetical protein
MGVERHRPIAFVLNPKIPRFFNPAKTLSAGLNLSMIFPCTQSAETVQVVQAWNKVRSNSLYQVTL